LDQDYSSDPVLAQALAYWRAKRRARAMPSRRDIDPTEIGPLLPHLQLIDVVDGGIRYRYRLAGTSLVAAFGREYTGRYLDELFAGERLAYAQRVFATVCSRQKAVFLRNRYSTTRDVDMMANRLYMPLSEDGCSVNVIFGALTFEFGRDVLPGFWSGAQLDPSTATLKVIEDEAIPA
jgi:hypothetical protein